MRNKIFFLKGGGWIYQDEADNFDEDDVDWHGFRIINPTEEEKMTIKPICR